MKGQELRGKRDDDVSNLTMGIKVRLNTKVGGGCCQMQYRPVYSKGELSDSIDERYNRF